MNRTHVTIVIPLPIATLDQPLIDLPSYKEMAYMPCKVTVKGCHQLLKVYFWLTIAFSGQKGIKNILDLKVNSAVLL